MDDRASRLERMDRVLSPVRLAPDIAFEPDSNRSTGRTMFRQTAAPAAEDDMKLLRSFVTVVILFVAVPHVVGQDAAPTAARSSTFILIWKMRARCFASD